MICAKPIYVFGGFGLLCLLGSIAPIVLITFGVLLAAIKAARRG